MMMPDMSVRAATRESDERETPKELFDFVCERVGEFTLDACATRENAKCRDFISVETDGLVAPWSGGVWCNPPYSDIEAWVTKAAVQMVQPASCERIVMLVPASPETDWWWSLWHKATEIVFLSPRVRFMKAGQKMGSPPFASALALLQPRLAAVSGPRVSLARWK